MDLGLNFLSVTAVSRAVKSREVHAVLAVDIFARQAVNALPTWILRHYNYTIAHFHLAGMRDLNYLSSRLMAKLVVIYAGSESFVLGTSWGRIDVLDNPIFFRFRDWALSYTRLFFTGHDNTLHKTLLDSTVPDFSFCPQQQSNCTL